MSRYTRFATAPSISIKRASFDLTHRHLTAIPHGRLIPIYTEKVLPGDTFSVNSEAFFRFTTQLKPTMSNVKFDIHYWYVPFRLVMDRYYEIHAARNIRPPVLTAPPSFSAPTGTLLEPVVEAPPGGFPVESLFDYMGIPIEVSGLRVNALPFRAYNLIMNANYRDENISNYHGIKTDETNDDWSMYTVSVRAKYHDLFTSALPAPQKGSPVNLLGISGQNVPVYASSNFQDLPTSSPRTTMRSSGVLSSMAPLVGYTNPGDNDIGLIFSVFPSDQQRGFISDPNLAPINNLRASTLGGVGSTPMLTAPFTPTNLGFNLDQFLKATTPDDFRAAWQISLVLQKDARMGSRDIEHLRAHYGVISPDARLQRPEYLGGGSFHLHGNTVANTANSSGQGQADLAAFSTATGRAGFRKSFVEHGVIIGLVSSRAELFYQRGLERRWSHRSRFDTAYPLLSNLGEQAILQKEIFATGTPSDDIVFGYNRRYYEYTYRSSFITGKMRSKVLPATPWQSLDYWHLAEDYSSAPLLNQAFLNSTTTPIDRAVAISTSQEPPFFGEIKFSIRAVRPLSATGIPSLIDHLL